LIFEVAQFYIEWLQELVELYVDFVWFSLLEEVEAILGEQLLEGFNLFFRVCIVI